MKDDSPTWLRNVGLASLAAAIPARFAAGKTMSDESLLYVAALGSAIAILCLPQRLACVARLKDSERLGLAIFVGILTWSSCVMLNESTADLHPTQVGAEVRHRPNWYSPGQLRRSGRKVRLRWDGKTYDVRVNRSDWASLRKGGRAEVELGRGVLGYWVARRVRGI